MVRIRSLYGIVALAGLMLPAAYGGDLSAVRSVTVVGRNPLRLQIQTNSKAAPQAQMISGPDRLVIDIPNSVQGTALRAISVNRQGVKGVRVGQFSATPPVMRVVVDLNSPQTYNIVPNAAGWLVSLGSVPATSATSPDSQSSPIIGWVSGKSAAKIINASASPTGKNLLRPALAANSVRVQFADGLLSIQATGATLAEVLFEVQKQTGAEIAIPAGAEQDRVAADFGPGPAGEVLGELLNGSGLNFVVVGSETDPRALRSVLLSRKSEEASGMPQAYAPAAAETVATESQEDLTPPDSDPAPPGDNSLPQQPVPPPADAGAAPPPTQ
jgi:hypothetical protein